jgi:hypothetical protein
MKMYRFTGPYKESRPFTISFETENEAFEYAQSMTDGPEMATIEVFDTGDWFYWNWRTESWVYDPQASKTVVPHYTNR